MANGTKLIGPCCSCISLIWGFVCAIIAINQLRTNRYEFDTVVASIPEPQIRIVNDDRFLGPVHIICSPPIVANYSTTCSDIFNAYKPITTTQEYFSWLYLDPRSRAHSIDHMTTITDITEGRHSLFIYLATLVVMGCFGKIITLIFSFADTAEKSMSEKMFGMFFAFVTAIF
eukprot:378620_1